jgi:hypothetical protein
VKVYLAEYLDYEQSYAIGVYTTLALARKACQRTAGVDTIEWDADGDYGETKTMGGDYGINALKLDEMPEDEATRGVT